MADKSEEQVSKENIFCSYYRHVIYNKRKAMIVSAD